ncbi:Glyoxalase/bleomycin resistance protein/dioxygenase [Legionella santicrucis]|uniref:Glyoxalase/bleomycin resistance protein/dioxygenase n=1 Tax=Legionella santicrucis TaxID=45074 RepID=A0A0W0YIK0_9GAMM|nr:VOC family protein [Legionella santicrucis]KTD56748.1 Glyoxalase/bleomycin resistance protein/dioxygenase [Legionella santicrucis]
MIKKVAFTMYPVIDMERARTFYENTLGITVSKISAQGAWVEYDLPGGGCFAITTLAEGVSPSAHAGGSIAFEVEDLEALVNKLKQKGVQFKLDIFSSPVCKMAIMLDSEGNAVTLHQLHPHS